MKKQLLILVVLLFSLNYVIAQKAMYKSAKSAWNDGLLDKALESIQAAITNDETKNQPDTWILKGKILQSIAADTSKKYINLVDNPVLEAWDSYMKAIEIDPKQKAGKEVDLMMLQLHNLSRYFGSMAFRQSNFEKSYTLFSLCVKIYDRPVFKGQIDTLDMLYSGILAIKVKKNDEAIAVLSKCIELKYGGPDAYSQLKTAYLQKGDTAKATEVLQTAYSKYPDELPVIFDMVNYYLTNNKAKDALEYIRKAKIKEPNNPSLFYAEGTLYEKSKDVPNAIISYKKSIEIDPKYFNGYYGLGAIYVDQAKTIYDEANAITDNNKYDVKMKEGDEQLRLALPYLEKSLELTSKNDTQDRPVVLGLLKQIYFRLDMKDKYNEVKNMIDQPK